MRILKNHPLLKLVNSYVVDSPQPSNLSYLWNFGSLLAFSLIIQIITGVTLAMHYNANTLDAFNSVEHIMRDVNNGWLIRYLHSNTASAFFFLVYLHIGRGLYYGSYKAPRTLVWTIGTVIFILMMATAFLGYVLPYGQMSLWGATVITNLMSAIPWIGEDIVQFIWGGFSVSNATLNRFFALHFVLPFILAALALMHLITLHERAGSGNPLGVSANPDRLPFAPYFIFKDLITIFIFMLALSVLVFYMPNILGDSENYVMANPMQTPPAIVPEWYLLPFYAILRSIPNKLLGVIAMFSAILILLVMSLTDLYRSRGIQFKPLGKVLFFVFVANFLGLVQLGAEHVESPFIEFGQISTVLYFAHFLIIVPFIGIIENSLTELLDYLGIKKEHDKNYHREAIPTYITTQSFLASPISYVFPSEEAKKASKARHRGIVVDDEDPEWSDDEAIKDGFITDDSDNEALSDDYKERQKLYDQYNEDLRRIKEQKQEDRDRRANEKRRIEQENNEETVKEEKHTQEESSQEESSNEKINNEENDTNTPNTSSLQPENSNDTNSAATSSLPLEESCDAPEPWGFYFQDSGTPQMEALVELHDNIMFYLVIILFGVGWTLVSIINVYVTTGSPISHKYLSHGASIELIWTITPAIILILIAFPSFKLLYLMDEVSDPAMVVLAEGHQWYWSYQYADFLDDDEEFVEFDSYLVPESDLEDGALRMLEVDNRLTIPELTHVRFIVAGADVIHSFACPSLGIKCDAYPGRLNQASVMINRAATFYGQCSEICGILHSSMPIVIESVSIEKYMSWLLSL